MKEKEGYKEHQRVRGGGQSPREGSNGAHGRETRAGVGGRWRDEEQGEVRGGDRDR